jgi:L-threonylcarbamoyladenylate synthase
MIDAEAKKAAEIVRSGGIILYPTDTIWGIGCDASSANAVQRIYEIKQRSDSKSMLVLADGLEMLSTYLEQVPEEALEIIRTAIKPTTIIYPGAIRLAPNLLAEDGSVGIRISSDEFCQKLIKETGFPIVSTSANISGNPAPVFFGAIESEIRQKVDYVVNWRQDENTPSAPSAIIKLDENGRSTVLRP